MLGLSGMRCESLVFPFSAMSRRVENEPALTVSFEIKKQDCFKWDSSRFKLKQAREATFRFLTNKLSDHEFPKLLIKNYFLHLWSNNKVFNQSSNGEGSN